MLLFSSIKYILKKNIYTYLTSDYLLMLCSTGMAVCMLSVTTYLYLNMTKTNFKTRCSKCNSLSNIIGVKQK